MFAALPLIFEGVKLVAGLFDEGKAVVEAVTGTPSTATTPEGLEAEVGNMTEEQREKWREAMSAKLDLYKAETNRLRNEQGSVTAKVLDALPPETAAKVAEMRMTTRPWVVRWCLRTLIFPIWAVFLIDMPIALHNLLSSAFGTAKTQIDYLASVLLTDSSGFVAIYTWFSPTAGSIIITYMTLRQVGIARGTGDSPGIAGIAGKAKSLYDKVFK